jgi:hypothetical protein
MPILGVFASSRPVITGAFESIATVTAAGGETSLTFSSIPATYAHLQIRGVIKRNASPAINLGWRFNGDTSSSYLRHLLSGDGATVSAGSVVAYTSAIDASMPGNVANIYGAFITDILDYANASKTKTVKTFGGYDQNGSGVVTLNSNLWTTTAAITSITAYFQGDTLYAGTTFTLYGIKGAA